MKSRHDTPETAASLLRWDFARDHHHVMCAVRATAEASSYEVATVPLWDVGRAAIETFKTAAAALRRHAAIAAELRDGGWRIASYTA
jgi:hypothetical protein